MTYNIEVGVGQPGEFIEFLSLFQEAIFDLTETGAFTPSEDYQKSLLISKLLEEYHAVLGIKLLSS